MNSAAYCMQKGMIMAAWLALSAGSGIAGPQTGSVAQQWLIDPDAEEHYRRAVGLANRRTQAAETEFRQPGSEPRTGRDTLMGWRCIIPIAINLKKHCR